MSVSLGQATCRAQLPVIKHHHTYYTQGTMLIYTTQQNTA